MNKLTLAAIAAVLGWTLGCSTIDAKSRQAPSQQESSSITLEEPLTLDEMRSLQSIEVVDEIPVTSAKDDPPGPYFVGHFPYMKKGSQYIVGDVNFGGATPLTAEGFLLISHHTFENLPDTYLSVFLDASTGAIAPVTFYSHDQKRDLSLGRVSLDYQLPQAPLNFSDLYAEVIFTYGRAITEDQTAAIGSALSIQNGQLSINTSSIGHVDHSTELNVGSAISFPVPLRDDSIFATSNYHSGPGHSGKAVRDKGFNTVGLHTFTHSATDQDGNVIPGRVTKGYVRASQIHAFIQETLQTARAQGNIYNIDMSASSHGR